MEYGSESGSVWNIALGVEVCGIWLLEWRCVKYRPGSGGVWNMALSVEVCGIWL